ncbi:MAG TPA: asparagine synthase (glutamine-hydrolyzing) [Gaiellaceae bacterium]
MCGIVGVLAARDAAPPDRERVARAVAALRHRGPDGNGIFADGPLVFGHTRLSIIDVAGGAQPLGNEDGTIQTIFNGEIWNFHELRDTLERAGHTFRTRCDTEVLVHGYEEWGMRLAEHLDGMFAFALWDARAERLLLARDRVGKKPLYVSRTGSGLAFGSDARSVLLAAGLTPSVRRDALAEFLFQRYVGAPRSLFEGIDRLPPGHQAVYDRTTYFEEPYWELHPGETRPLEETSLRGLLRESVRARLQSDVPLGVLLSGGIDSSAVLGLMREAGAESIASFTIGFTNPVYDERPLARIAAVRNATEHHEVVVDEHRFHEPLARLAWFRDEPIAEPSEIPLLLLAEEAGRHVKVVLSGDGGDELYGGYPKYAVDRLVRLPMPGRIALLKLASRLSARRAAHRRIDRAVETLAIRDDVERWGSWFRSFSLTEVGTLLAPDLAATAADDAIARLRTVLEPYGYLDAGRRMLVGDFHTYLPDNMLLRSDKVLMGASVEGRMPLLDHHVVERVSDVSAADRIRRGTPKALLRAATSDLIPPEIQTAVKRGFTVPTAALLLDDPHSPLRVLLTSDRLADRGLIDKQALDLLVEGSHDVSNRPLKLFTIASLELWLRANVDRITETPPTSLEDLLDADELARLPAAALERV